VVMSCFHVGWLSSQPMDSIAIYTAPSHSKHSGKSLSHKECPLPIVLRHSETEMFFFVIVVKVPLLNKY
jgi:hypothetical protein